ncbi:heavy-metal-associated domain-containing protein [Actinopolymorpha alba]|uniref:heavy-metal-associated domain-containing protein n=1 Tax=Actinopolymorpha alba TaxID=533267 RepID=UPI000367B410|nr:heavy metal-associated domain-containing protein [Actinopolymorpha alba]
MSATTYTVAGMTCNGCAGKVTSKVGQLAGITDTKVDLATGQLTVTSDGSIDDAKIRDAVEEAGYEIKD